MEPETHTDATTFDSLIQDRQLQMLKAAIPYVNDSSRRTLALLVNYMELTRTISLLQEPEISIQMCSAPEDEPFRPLKLLGALREFCTEKEQGTIDMLLRCMELFSADGTRFP